eukprot:1113428_1
MPSDLSDDEAIQQQLCDTVYKAVSQELNQQFHEAILPRFQQQSNLIQQQQQQITEQNEELAQQRRELMEIQQFAEYLNWIRGLCTKRNVVSLVFFFFASM